MTYLFWSPTKTINFLIGWLQIDIKSVRSITQCLLLIKESSNSDGLLFHQYQQNEQPTLTSNHQIQTKTTNIWCLKSRSWLGTVKIIPDTDIYSIFIYVKLANSLYHCFNYMYGFMRSKESWILTYCITQIRYLDT